MCTLVLLRRPSSDWPVIIATNRDERIDRPWEKPARHWQEFPKIIAGLDKLAGGTWLGMNEQGLVSGIMNRSGTLGAKCGFRSRGGLVLQALESKTAKQALKKTVNCTLTSYRSFNLVVADRDNAFWIRWQENEQNKYCTWENIPFGISMFTAMERNDLRDARIEANLTRFRKLKGPNPEKNDWSEWKKLLMSDRYDHKSGPLSAMKVNATQGFATVSSSLIALPGRINKIQNPIWFFARHYPLQTKFTRVKM